MTRLYIELSSGTKDTSTSKENEELVKRQAKEIMAPFIVEWKSVEWFGVYRGMSHRITENSRTKIIKKKSQSVSGWLANSLTEIESSSPEMPAIPTLPKLPKVTSSSSSGNKFQP